MNTGEFVIIGSYLAEGFLAGAVAIGVYGMKKHVEAKDMKFTISQMLVVELSRINRSLSSSNLDRFNHIPLHSMKFFPRSIYDGLVSSGNIAQFDWDIQEKLHDFYVHEKRREYDHIDSKILDIYRMVDDFKLKNRTWWRALMELSGRSRRTDGI